MVLKPKRARKLVEEKIGTLEEKISSIEPPHFHRKHGPNKLLLLGIPVAGLMALGVFWRARMKRQREALPDEATTRLPFDPAMSSPREEVTMEREMPMEGRARDMSPVPGSPEDLAPFREQRSSRPAEQPLDRSHFPPGGIDDQAGVMDNRPLQADTPVDPPVTDFQTLVGMEVKDVEGKDLGRVESIYYHEANGVPEWVGFTTGLLNPREVWAPLEAAAVGEHHLWLAYPKDIIEDAPSVHGDQLNYDEEKSLYSYYHVRRMFADHQRESDPGDELLRKWQPGESEDVPKRRSA